VFFSDKLIQSVPTFTAHVTEIAEKLSDHATYLRQEAAQKDNIRALLAEHQENIQRELRKQTDLIELIVTQQKLQHNDALTDTTGEIQPDSEENEKEEDDVQEPAVNNDQTIQELAVFEVPSTYEPRANVVGKIDVGGESTTNQEPAVLESNVESTPRTDDEIYGENKSEEDH